MGSMSSPHVPSMQLGLMDAALRSYLPARLQCLRNTTSTPACLQASMTRLILGRISLFCG